MLQKTVTSCTLDSTFNNLVYLPLKECYKRGAEFIYFDEDLQILVSDKESTVYINTKDLDTFINKGVDINYANYEFVNVYDKNIGQYIKTKYQFDVELEELYVFEYIKDTKVQVLDTDFRVLDLTYIDIIEEHYDCVSHDEILNDLKSGHIFGLFKEEKLVGFIGIHPDYTMGMLRIFKEYQRRGYAYELEGNLINYLIDNGLKAFCHVHTHNEASINLQLKLGMVKADTKQYWLYKYEKN